MAANQVSQAQLQAKADELQQILQDMDQDVVSFNESAAPSELGEHLGITSGPGALPLPAFSAH